MNAKQAAVQAFTNTMAPAGATFDTAIANANAATSIAMTNATAQENNAVTDASTAFQNAEAEAAATQADTSVGAQKTWLDTEADASSTLAGSQATALKDQALTNATAAQSLKYSLATAQQQWQVQADTAANTEAAAGAAANQALSTAQNSALASWESATTLAQIGQQGTDATDWAAEQSAFEQTQAEWNSALAQTSSAVASATATADANFMALVAPAAAQEQLSVAQAAQTATDNWATAQGTSWAQTVAAEALAETNFVSVDSGAQSTLQQQLAANAVGWQALVGPASINQAADAGAAQVAEIQRIAGDWVTYLQQATSYASTEANSAVTALQANLTAQTTAADTQLTETTAADTAFAGAEANAASALIDGEAVASFNQATTSAGVASTETASIASANKADQYATATAAQEQIANDAAAQATQQIDDANAEATRVKAGWNAYATYATVQANADATQTELIDTASSTYKMALATADTTWSTAIANAQITAKGAQAQAQYDYALAIAYSSPIQLLSAANDKLSADQNALASTFANVQPQPLQATVYQLAADAYKNDGFLGLFSYTADVASNGGWSRTLLSPQFTRALNAADGIFAGWADVLTGHLSTKLRTAMWGDLATRNHSGQYFELGQTIGEIQLMAFQIAINPCALGAAARWAYRGLEAIQAVYNLGSVYSDLEQGHYFAAGLDALSVFGSVFNMFRACFVAGTPLLTPEGSKPIEQFEVGDTLLSRDEFTPVGEVRARRVLAKFQTISPILNLHVRGRIIGTTSEHPFWVEGAGWIAAKDLRIGDVLVSHDGQRLPVEGVADSGRVEAVYNLAVEDDHTYGSSLFLVGDFCLFYFESPSISQEKRSFLLEENR